MKEIKNLIPMALFSVFFIKCTIMQFSYADVAVLAVLGLVTCYLEFQGRDKKLQVLEDKLNLAVNSFDDKSKQIEDIKGAISGLKLSAITRPMNQAR